MGRAQVGQAGTAATPFCCMTLVDAGDTFASVYEGAERAAAYLTLTFQGTYYRR